MEAFDPQNRHIPRFLTEDWLEVWRSFGFPLRERVEYLARFWAMRGTRVFLYPAGQCTRQLLETTHLRRVVVGIGDENPGTHGSLLSDFRIVEPQGISSLQPDVIFVTSNFNETEICQFLESLQLSIPILPLSNLPPVPNPIDIWTWDETFQDRFNSVRPLSLLDERRAFCLDAWAQHALGCIGDFAEIGVYQGASAVLLAQRLQGTCRSLHLFDTFQGMPTADAELDLYETGSLADTTLQKVHHRLAPFEFAHLYPGIFPTTASPIEGLSFAFVHVDVDIHQSVLDCCAFFYPHMSPGGVLLFDDYGFVECAGAMEAVNTFFSGKPEHPCYLPTGQCVVVRHHAH